MSTPPVFTHPACLAAPVADRALLGLHRAIEFKELWVALQRIFDALVPYDTLVMSVNYVDWRKETTTLRLTSANSRVRHDETGERLVVEEGRGFFQPFLERNPGVPCYRHTQVMEREADMLATGYYQRYILPNGWRYSAHLLFWRERNVETAFAIRRRPEQGDFSDEEMSLLRALHPHIGVAFERVRAFEHERRRRRLLEAFYRAKPEAVMFLDWELRPLYASQEALILCAIWNHGPERAQVFTPQAVFSVPTPIATCCEVMKPAWRGAEPAAQMSQAKPLTREVNSEWIGHGADITLRQDGTGAFAQPIFVVRLRAPGGPAEESAAGLGRLSGLTPAERRLVEMVCEGLSNKEIAARLSRTEGSVKVQLSAVFRKVRVKSRTQLINAVR